MYMSVVSSRAAFKILVVGDPGVGKTSITRRSVGKSFSAHHHQTVGVDFFRKNIQVINTPEKVTEVSLQIWDIAGQDRGRQVTRAYYQMAAAAFIVFDICEFQKDRQTSLKSIDAWLTDIRRKVKIPIDSEHQMDIPLFLLANKCDKQRLSASDQESLQAYMKEKNIQGMRETSAKNEPSIGIEEAISNLALELLKVIPPSYGSTADTLQLGALSIVDESHCSC